MSTSSAIVYSKTLCQACDTAVRLLENRGVKVDVRKVDLDSSFKEEMLTAFPNARSVPQIIIDGQLVGDLTRLRMLLE